jgi:hypothetical protein
MNRPKIDQTYRTNDGAFHLTMQAAMAHQLRLEMEKADVSNVLDISDELAVNIAFRNKFKNILKWLD